MLFNKIRARGKARKNTPKTISISQAEEDALTAANAKANEIFTASPKGRDTMDPVYYEESLLWEDFPEQINLKSAGGSSIPQPYNIVITRNVIAVMETVFP